MARTPNSSGDAKKDVGKSAAGDAKRSSGRERKTRELFNIQVEEKRVRKPRSSSKKGTPKKTAGVRKSARSSKKSAKRRITKRSETPEEEEEEDDREYEVDKIINHRIYNDFYVEYEVTWKGYSKDDTNWLTEYDLRSSPKILAEYKLSVTNKEDKPGDEYVVEKILAHRDVGNARYYLVHWHGYDHPVSHTEMDRHELSQARDVLLNYESDLLKKKNKASNSTPKRKQSKAPAKKAKVNGKVQDEEEENSDEGAAHEEEEEVVTSEVQEESDDGED